LGGSLDCLRYDGLLAGPKATKNMIDGLPRFRFPNTDAQAGVFFCAQMELNVPQAIVPSVTPATTESQLAQR
jgi:hypothetical protein